MQMCAHCGDRPSGAEYTCYCAYCLAYWRDKVFDFTPPNPLDYEDADLVINPDRVHPFLSLRDGMIPDAPA